MLIEGKEIDHSFAVHVLRNPYGWDDKTVRACRLFACEKLESYKDAIENLREFAEENGLDTRVYG